MDADRRRHRPGTQPTPRALPRPARPIPVLRPTRFPEGVYLAESPSGEVVTMTYGDGVWRRILEDGTVDCVSTYVDRVRSDLADELDRT